jgi:hypothetical protein
VRCAAPSSGSPATHRRENLLVSTARRPDCAGPIELRTTPDRTDGKHFARCEHHFDVRMESVARTLELTSPARPAWFDESYAGERWDED